MSPKRRTPPHGGSGAAKVPSRPAKDKSDGSGPQGHEQRIVPSGAIVLTRRPRVAARELATQLGSPGFAELFVELMTAELARMVVGEEAKRSERAS